MVPLRHRLLPLALMTVVVAILSGCATPVTSTIAAVALDSAPTPRVTGLSANSGSLVGGETIVVSGFDLSGVDRVLFGGEEATSVTVTDANSVAVVVPHSYTYTEATVPVTVFSSTQLPAIQSAVELQYSYRTLTDVDRQLEYAFAHWNNYNLAQYGDFTSWGGDCMDFVSQTLVARGWVPTADWFNDAQENWAPAFVDVPSFDEWLSSHPEYGATRLTMDQRAQLKIGDIVMFDWNGDGSLDHAQIVSGMRMIDGHLHIYLVGHDIDTHYRDLDQALVTEGCPDAIAYFWSLPA